MKTGPRVFSRCIIALLCAGSALTHAQTNYTWRLAWQSPPSGGATLLGLAYDYAHNQAVLVDTVGGTWIWSSDSSTWSRRYPAHNPPNRNMEMERQLNGN